MDFDYYKEIYGDYLDDEEIEMLMEYQLYYLQDAYNAQQTAEFWEKIKESDHSEIYLTSNEYRMDFIPGYFDKWIEEMDHKYHADWYAEPEKYASEIEQLEASRTERKSHYCGGLPANVGSEFLWELYADQYMFEHQVDIHGDSAEAKEGYEYVAARVAEWEENYKGLDEYCQETYGCDSEAYYYYFMESQINGDQYVSQYKSEMYQAKQNIDKLPFAFITMTEDYYNAEVDTRFNYPEDFDALIDDYEKSWTWNKDYLRSTYGVNSKSEWEAFKILSFMPAEDKKLYFYLLETNQDLANDLLMASMDDANKRIAGINTINTMRDWGLIEMIDPNGEKYDMNNYRITCNPQDIPLNYAISFGFGVKDGVVQWGEGIYNALAADGMKSVNEYERMYFVQMLATASGAQSGLDEVYQVGNAFGNMLPTFIISTAFTVASGGAGSAAEAANIAKAGRFITQASMLLSAYGNTKEQYMQAYNVSGTQASLYGLFIAGVSVGTERMGSVLNLGDKRATNFLEAFAMEGRSEAMETLLQKAIDIPFTGEVPSVDELLKEMASSYVIGGSVGAMYHYPNMMISAMTISRQTGVPYKTVLKTYEAYLIAANSNPDLNYSDFIQDQHELELYTQYLTQIAENPNETQAFYESYKTAMFNCDYNLTIDEYKQKLNENYNELKDILHMTYDQYTHSDVALQTLNAQLKLEQLNIEGLTAEDAYKLTQIYKEYGMGKFNMEMTQEQFSQMCKLLGTDYDLISMYIEDAYKAIEDYKLAEKNYKDYIASGGTDEKTIKQLYEAMQARYNEKNLLQSNLDIFSTQKYKGLQDIDNVLDKRMEAIEEFCREQGLDEKDWPTREMIEEIMFATKEERANMSLPQAYIDAVEKAYYTASSPMEITYTGADGTPQKIEITEGENIAFKFVSSSAADSGMVGGFVLGTDQIEIVKQYAIEHGIDSTNIDEHMPEIMKFVENNIIATDEGYLSKASVVVFHGDLDLTAPTGAEFGAMPEYWIPGMSTKTPDNIHEMNISFDYEQLGTNSDGLKYDYIVTKDNYTTISVEDYLKFVIQ